MQPPAPFHVTSRGFAGPSLLAMILFEKFGQHQPLNRQSERYAREGIDLSLSTLADQVGACAVALPPLYALIERHVLAAERLHGDDTTVPILAKGQTVTGRVWVYVRDDRSSAARTSGGAVLRLARSNAGASRAASGRLRRHSAGRRLRWLQPPLSSRPEAWSDRRGAVLEPRAAEVLRTRRHRGERRAGQDATPISPIALGAVRRIDALFDIEREINRLSAAWRLAARRERSAPLVGALEGWMRAERAKLSRHAAVAKAIDYMLTRWPSFTRFLEDGRICLTNNAAERALRGLALGRKSWLFAGSERGAERAALMYTLIGTAKLNGLDPQAWLADILACIADHPVQRLDELLPWNWAAERLRRNLAA
jgi:hypothetical protein